MDTLPDPPDATATEYEKFRETIRALRYPEYSILLKLLGGGTFSEAARAGHISRATLWRWCRDCAGFSQLVNEARRIGARKRSYFLWLSHPFRGKRPPCATGGTVGNRPKPKWTFGNFP